jgi:hypothetical protein
LRGKALSLLRLFYVIFPNSPQGEIMRKIAIAFMTVVLIFALGIMNSIAEEKKKVSDTTYWFVTKTEVIKVNEAKGHIIQISESKGINVSRKELAIFRNTYDLVKGCPPPVVNTVMAVVRKGLPQQKASRILISRMLKGIGTKLGIYDETFPAFGFCNPPEFDWKHF